MNTVTLVSYTAKDGQVFRFADTDRSAALQGMRTTLRTHALVCGLKRNWFDPDDVKVTELRLGVGYRGDTEMHVKARAA